MRSAENLAFVNEMPMLKFLRTGEKKYCARITAANRGIRNVCCVLYSRYKK